MRLLIYPGATSALLSLQAVLQEAHDAVVVARAEEIAKREADGIPLDDHTRWPAVDGFVEELAAAAVAMDTAGAIALVRKVDKQLSRKALVPIPAYKPIPARDLVQVRFVALEDVQRRTLLAKAAEAQERIDVKAEQDVLTAAIVERDEAVKDFIGASICELIVGEDHIKGPPDRADLEALKLAGLLWDLYNAARDYQELSPGKAGRFGPRPQST
jgi:hypothetical protein